MSIGSSFRELGRFLDECEGTDRTVTGVAVADADGVDGDAGLAVAVELAVSPQGEDGPALCSPRLGPDGRLRFAVDVAGPLVPTDDCDVDVDLLDANVDTGGTVTARLRATPRGPGTPSGIDSPDRAGFETGVAASDASQVGNDSGSLAADDDTEPDDGDVPPFKDPDLLADVYESCDTFAQMADVIDMDVTAETVRRYMIDYDIHQPNTYQTAETDGSEAGNSEADDAAIGDSREADSLATEDGAGVDRTDGDDGDRLASGDPLGSETGRRGIGESADRGPEPAPADAEAAEPVVLSDGIGLPDDVTVDTLIDTVKRSNTIYEVTREINVDRQDALDVLEELNLLDLVVGRLATEGERDLSREAIVDRLREAPGTQ